MTYKHDIYSSINNRSYMRKEVFHMNILVAGASGTIGGEIVKQLEHENEIIRAGRNGADIQVDLTSVDSIKNMYQQIGKVDAVINASGRATFAPLTQLTPEMNTTGIESKVIGQVRLLLLGVGHVRDVGSVSLTTGVMVDDRIRQGGSAAVANGAVKHFVKVAANEMLRGIRINSVSSN